MIAMKRNAGLIVSGALLLALVGCTAGEPPATAEDHAQTVERDAGTDMVPGKPAVPSEDGATPEAVEVTRAADGSSAELRKADPAAAPSSSAPAQPAQ